ncbi:MAG: BamA/TamA family outer membrane protein [Spirochaetales bacterium]|nr:BamA/TamA family outer membrane protein [Spirochaetales bacterium]
MKKALLILLLTTVSVSLFAEEEATEDKDIAVEEQVSEERIPEPFKLYNAIVPFIGNAPATGFFGGVGLSTGIFLGDPSTTNMSSAITSVSYSTKNQLNFLLKSNMFTSQNQWNLVGDWRLFFSSQDTFGLGTGPQLDNDQALETMGEGMDFNLVRFHETASRQIIPGLYAGLGYHLDVYSNIRDNASTEDYTGFHQEYSLRNGYDPTGYMMSGVSANLYYDTRDNVANPYQGRYAMASYRVMPEWLGNDNNGSTLWLEYRDYLRLQKSNPRHMIGLWTYGHFSYGTLPYMGLPSVGWDQMGRSGRGFAQGRFRGDHIYYAEIEYRFPIPFPWVKNNPDFLGGVLFTNVTTVADKHNGVDLFDYLEPAFGGGIRIMLQKESRANLNIDYAVRMDGTGALYININESF